MARTKAQRTKEGKKNYGKNYERGRRGEEKAAAALRRDGYSVTMSRGSRGPDLTARKNGRTRHIQVKTISSRSFSSPAVAENRMRGAPFYAAHDREVWIYDKAGQLHKIKK